MAPATPMPSRITVALRFAGVELGSEAGFTERNCVPDSCRTGDWLSFLISACCSISSILVLTPGGAPSCERLRGKTGLLDASALGEFHELCVADSATTAAYCHLCND